MRPEEVSMRPPSVFVRPLQPEEGQRLKRLSKRAKHYPTRQRAAIVLASATGLSAAQVASALLTDESHAPKVIHAFNERGFDSLTPNWRGGRPRRLGDDERARRDTPLVGCLVSLDSKPPPWVRWAGPCSRVPLGL
jgi:hypothetical protein